MNNFEKITGMTKEELAKFVAERSTCDMCVYNTTAGFGICETEANCYMGVLEWLNKEARKKKVKE